MRVQISTTLNREIEPIREALPNSIIVSISGWSQSVYKQGHRGGNIEHVKRRLVELDSLRRWTGRKLEIILAWHRYKHNLHEEHLAADYARRMGFKFRPVDAIYMSLPDILQSVNVKKDVYTNLLRQPKDVLVKGKTTDYCPRQQHQLFIDCTGNVHLCCSSHTHSLGQYLETTWDKLLDTKIQHPTCTVCKLSGVKNYVCPSVTLHDKMAQRAVGSRLFCGLKKLFL